jgi:hypothetical protein
MRKKEEKKVASRSVFSPFSPHQFLCFFFVMSPFVPSHRLFCVPCCFTERQVSHADCYSQRLPHTRDFPSTFSSHLAPSHSRPTPRLANIHSTVPTQLARSPARPPRPAPTPKA